MIFTFLRETICQCTFKDSTYHIQNLRSKFKVMYFFIVWFINKLITHSKRLENSLNSLINFFRSDQSEFTKLQIQFSKHSTQFIYDIKSFRTTRILAPRRIKTNKLMENKVEKQSKFTETISFLLSFYFYLFSSLEGQNWFRNKRKKRWEKKKDTFWFFICLSTWENMFIVLYVVKM